MIGPGRARLRVLALLACSALSACGPAPAGPIDEEATSGGEDEIEANTNATSDVYTPPAASSAPPPSSSGGARWPGRSGSGASIEDPVSACGPGDSYRFVAREFQCPGGGNPLGGDDTAGARARVGNVGANSTRHIIDLYRVPCGTGPVDVYVDMYGCPQMRSMLGE